MAVASVANRVTATSRTKGFFSWNSRLIIAGTLVFAAVLAAGYVGKRRCVGPTFDQAGRSGPDWRIRINADLCYSDIQQMWLGRDINLHVFPYIHGGITSGGQPSLST